MFLVHLLQSIHRIESGTTIQEIEKQTNNQNKFSSNESFANNILWLVKLMSGRHVAYHLTSSFHLLHWIVIIHHCLTTPLLILFVLTYFSSILILSFPFVDSIDARKYFKFSDWHRIFFSAHILPLLIEHEYYINSPNLLFFK